MSDYTLYGGTLPHVAGNETSFEAARSMVRAAEGQRREVYTLLSLLPNTGATDDEIEEYLDARHQSISARRRELVLLGLVKDSGDRRRTRGGRNARVWKAV